MARAPFGRRPQKNDNARSRAGGAPDKGDGGAGGAGGSAGGLGDDGLDLAMGMMTGGVGGSRMGRMGMGALRGLGAGLSSGAGMRGLMWAGIVYVGGRALMDFVNGLGDGGKSVPSKLADGSARSLDSQEMDRALSSKNGKEAVAGSKEITNALEGNSAVSRRLDTSMTPGINRADAANYTKDNVAGLNNSLGRDVVRVTLPGGDGKYYDYKPQGAFNDRSALHDFQNNYESFAKKNGLPQKLPEGSVILIGDAGGLISSAKDNAREFRYMGGNEFEKNSVLSGSIDNPGSNSWSRDRSYKEGLSSWSQDDVSVASRDVVSSANLTGQVIESSNIEVGRSKFGKLDGTEVNMPVGFLSGVGGMRTGSAFLDAGLSVGAVVDTSEIIRTTDVVSGVQSVGVKGENGGISISSGPSGDNLSMYKSVDGVNIYATRNSSPGSLGVFDENGRFQGSSEGLNSMEAMTNGFENVSKSPIISASKELENSPSASVHMDLSKGKESVTTRLAFEDRVVDYHVKDGSMMMIERDPKTHEARDASVIRSHGIKVSDGVISMDKESLDILRDHVAHSAEGGAGKEFSDRHPSTKENLWARNSDSGRDQAVTSGLASLERGDRVIDGPAAGVDKLAAIKDAGASVIDPSLMAQQMQLASSRPAKKDSGFEIGG